MARLPLDLIGQMGSNGSIGNGQIIAQIAHGNLQMAKPRVALTVGDPAGIGPEIARKAADDPRVREVCEPILYGPPAGASFAPGVLSAEAGRAAYDCICAAVR